jgi:NAD+ dependent glucose-6-phosphate dehydrogenase
MSDQPKTVLITGANGNLGRKLADHLRGRYNLRLLDRQNGNDAQIVQADLAVWDDALAQQFAGVDAVVHLAANPDPSPSWDALKESNIDTVVNTFTAAARAGVKRLVYASSNHAMGRYKDIPEPAILTTDIPVRPGTLWQRDGQVRDSMPYGAMKMMGERVGKCYADVYGMSVIAVRIGWVMRGENLPGDMQPGIDDWLRLMWLSNRDFCNLFECCVVADPSIHFAIVNGMSNNRGMRWDIEHTKQVVGYKPQDDVTQG